MIRDVLIAYKPDAEINARQGLLIFCTLMALAFMLLLSQIYVGGYLSWLSLVYYIAFSALIVKHYPAAFVLLLWFIFIRLTTMISGVAIENNGYMPEVLMQGYPTGAFVRLAALYTIGVLFCVLVLNTVSRSIDRLETPPERQIKLWSYPVFIMVALFCGGAVFIGVKNGFPALEQVDRMLYWKKIDNRFFYFFLGNRPIFTLFLGLIFSISRGVARKICLALFLLVLVVSLLFAEKFASICMMFFFFVTPVFLRNQSHLSRLSSRLIPLGAVIATITIPAILVAYGFGDNSEGALTRLQARATSQAQIWFVADTEQDKFFNLDHQRLDHNIKSLFTKDADDLIGTPPYLGVRDFMVDYMEEDRYEHYQKRGVSFTLGTEGYLLRMFGWAGIVPAYCFILVIYCLQLSYLYYAISKADPIRLLLAAKILIWSNYGLNQGYFFFMFGVKTMVLVAAALFLELELRALTRRSRAGGT